MDYAAKREIHGRETGRFTGPSRLGRRGLMKTADYLAGGLMDLLNLLTCQALVRSTIACF